MSKPREDRPLEIGGILLADAYHYLDALRESGDTNMWAASLWLIAEYEISKVDASSIHSWWMQDFSKEENNGAGRD